MYKCVVFGVKDEGLVGFVPLGGEGAVAVKVAVKQLLTEPVAVKVRLVMISPRPTA